MNNETALLEEVRALRLEIEALRADKYAKRGQQIADSVAPRVSPYTVKEFAQLIRRHPEFVSERCKIGVIKSLPGKPYRIPVSQLRLWTEAA